MMKKSDQSEYSIEVDLGELPQLPDLSSEVNGENSGTCSPGCDCGDFSLKTPIVRQFEWGKKTFPFIIGFMIAILGFLVEKLNVQLFSPYLTLILFSFSYIIVSYRVIRTVFKNLNIKTIFDENFLMFIATIGGILTNNFLEAIAVMLFYKLGQIVEDYGVFKSKKSITSLLENQPQIAHVKTEFGMQTLHPQEVSIGEILIVKPGEKIPLDGIMLSNYSMVDTSLLTGESVPRRILLNEPVSSGMVNLSELIEYKVTAIFENSTIARILDLVQNAEANKSISEKFTRKFAKYYTPGVVLSAFLLFLLPPLILPNATFADWLYRSMIFLVISCPCALVLSVPLTYFGGIGGASRHGILIKGTQHLETLTKLDTIVFDKTGTITKGNFQVSEIKTLNDITSEEILAMVASAEMYSNHPVAQSIITSYGEQQSIQNTYDISEFKEIPGLGIMAIVNGKELIAGSDKMLHRYEVPHNSKYCDIIGTVVHVGIDNEHIAYILISDELKTNTIQKLDSLRNSGIKHLVMLSGDDKQIVQEIAQQLKFDEFHAELLPAEKVQYFERLKNRNRDRNKDRNRNKIAYVGDGFNDAPVIARADVGFAMGGFGSDAAIEAADVVLMTDDISKITQSIQIARQTRRINWQNIASIFLVKGAFLLLGALGLMTMWGAIFADVGMALIAIFNSRRMLHFTPRI